MNALFAQVSTDYAVLKSAFNRAMDDFMEQLALAEMSLEQTIDEVMVSVD